MSTMISREYLTKKTWYVSMFTNEQMTTYSERIEKLFVLFLKRCFGAFLIFDGILIDGNVSPSREVYTLQMTLFESATGDLHECVFPCDGCQRFAAKAASIAFSPGPIVIPWNFRAEIDFIGFILMSLAHKTGGQKF